MTTKSYFKIELATPKGFYNRSMVPELTSEQWMEMTKAHKAERKAFFDYCKGNKINRQFKTKAAAEKALAALEKQTGKKLTATELWPLDLFSI
jgi:hypothetical protein